MARRRLGHPREDADVSVSGAGSVDPSERHGGVPEVWIADATAACATGGPPVTFHRTVRAEGKSFVWQVWETIGVTLALAGAIAWIGWLHSLRSCG